ncbi:MAG: hypothetical protein IPN53_03180 [Comamonadaceae bacterium]|nr:hypothetical protein [Comamonadaceae bacterium]
MFTRLQHSIPKRTTRRLVLAGALLLAGASWAAPADKFDKAFAVFQQAAAGQESAIQPSTEAFEALLKVEPTNPVLLAYVGAATSMKANTTWFPWKKMTYAEDGLAMLDKALAMLTAVHNAPLQHEVPAVLEVKFVAASTFLAVPGFMNRSQRGASLLADVVSSALLATAPLAFRGDVWLAAAEQARKDQRLEVARQHLNQIIKTNAPQAAIAQSRLGSLAS